jgi:type IV secretory pathway VirB2 component (pilin)
MIKREKGLHALVKTRRFATLAILIILSLNLFALSLLPQAFAAVHPVLTISPNKGYVGETVAVNGSFVTPGKNYTVFFDNISVKNGTANYVGNFTNTFVVPPSVNGTHEVHLYDVSSGNMSTPVDFTIETAYYIKAINLPVQPNQLQEGNNVTISAQIVGGGNSTTYFPLNVTVTTPAKTIYYNASFSLTTNSTGTANGTLTYPIGFEPTNASNTNFTGTYLLQLFYKNVTTPQARSSFSIGLTNATLYQRFDWVNVKAANYTEPSENATVTIRFGNTTIVSQKTPATNGTIIYNWQVPVNASEGSYMVTVTAISGANKKVPDAQNFTVPGLLVSIETTNLDGASVAKVITAVYKTVKGSQTLVASNSTNSKGLTTSTLTQGGNYTLKAYYEAAQVNTTNIYVTENSSWTLTCQITNIEFTVKDNTPKHNPLPLVLLNVTVAYKTFENVSQTAPEDNLTNTAGEGIFLNQLVMANYTVRAYRAPYQAQLLFNTTELTTVAQAINRNITIICPLLNLTVHAEDAKNALLAGYPVQIYEFLGGLYNYSTTDASGNVTFSATFGEYQVRLYDPNETILLNETYYNLVNASAFLLVRSEICHANLSITVLDYLGLPIPNISVELERDGAPSITLKTNGKGVAFFDGITGGNCYISISTGSGSPIETANVLVQGNTATTVTLKNYVSVLGLLIGTNQFAVILTFIVLIILLLFFLLYRRRSKASEEKKTEKKS